MINSFFLWLFVALSYVEHATVVAVNSLSKFPYIGLPTSEIEGSYRTICSKPENNGRNLASKDHVNVFERCGKDGSHTRRNCPEDTYFLEFLEECVFGPCGRHFENKIFSAIDDGRASAKPCRSCKISCNGDVFDGDRCESSIISTPKPPPDSERPSTEYPGSKDSVSSNEPPTTTYLPPSTTPDPRFECPIGVDYAVNIPHPCGCRKYQVCQRGKSTIAFCRKGMIYDIPRRMCNRETDVKCPNEPNCDNDLLFNERSNNSDPTLFYSLSDLMRIELFDLDSKYERNNPTDDHDYKIIPSDIVSGNDSNIGDIEPYGLLTGTNINIGNIHVNVIIPQMIDEEFEIVSPFRDDCANPNTPRNFQFQREYYDMYATCVNDRETKIVFCPDGTYFNWQLEFCIPIPNGNDFLPVDRGDFGDSTSNRCRYCTPESNRVFSVKQRSYRAASWPTLPRFL